MTTSINTNKVELFFAGTHHALAQMFFECTGRKINVLLSFFNYWQNPSQLIDDVKSFKTVCGEVILDSGGFSTMQKGLTFGAKVAGAHYQFLKNLKEKDLELFFRIMAFDISAKPESFKLNYGLFVDELKVCPRVVPVIHDIKSHTELDAYMALHPEALAIGKCQWKRKQEKIKPFAEKIHESGFNWHYLGVTEKKLLQNAYPETCDSSSAIARATRGMVVYYPPNSTKWDVLYFPEKDESPAKAGRIPIEQYAHQDTFFEEMTKTFHCEVEDFFNSQRETFRTMANIYTLLRMADMVNASRKGTEGGNNAE